MTKAFVLQVIAGLEDALLKNVGIGSVSVDGQSVSFISRTELLEEYNLWHRRLAELQGKRSMFRTINISGGAQA